MRFRSQ